MNAVVDEATKKVTEFRAPGPGERLRAARLAHQLDLSKVAAQLHLSDAMVEALERDDYERLPGRVFVRGYLRNYARLVDVPVDSVLKQFDDQVPDHTEQHRLNPVGSSIRSEVRSSHGLVRVFTWLVVLGLAALFVTWWKGYLSWEEAGAPLAPAATLEPVSPAVDEDGRLALPQREALSDNGPTTAAEPPSSGVVSPLPTAPTGAGVAIAEVPASRAAHVPLPRPQPPVATSVASGSAAVATVPASAIAAEAAAPPVTSAGGIVFEFNGPCWVDVRDAKRKFKLFGEMPKGTRKVLGGEPPYDVVLGNASVVQVTVNGELYDIAQHSRGNVARFRLDPTSN